MSDRETIEAPLAAQVLMAETVRLVETQGPLDDAQVLRALDAGTEQVRARDGWLLARAWRLGERLGLDEQLRRWRHAAVAALLGLVALLLLGAIGAAGAVVHNGRTVNAVAAFLSLLGLHGLTLGLWLIGLVVPWSGSGGVLGRLWLEAMARLSKGRNAHAAHATSLLQASIQLLRRERLAPGLFGCVSHTVWALSFLVMLGVLGFAFSFQAYRLTWETTILGPDFFVSFVQWTGWLPARLGFPVPDSATLLAPGAAGADQRAWAWWLIGCVATYGLLPRAVLAMACGLWWRRRSAALALDTTQPYYRALLARRDALQPVAVVDAETPWHVERPEPVAVQGAGAAVLGFELPPEEGLPAVAAGVWSRVISGTSGERNEVLQTLRARPPARLLVVCHAPSSPDRGTARFLREAADHAGATSLLLVGEAVAAEDTARWADWLQAMALPTVTLHTDAAAAVAWTGAAVDA